MMAKPDGVSDGSVRSPNIITIVLDCARAGNFSTSGRAHIARTPVIDSLAAQGTAFPRAVAPANWTVPSHFSIFTGSYPNVHGIRTFQRATELPEMTASYLQRMGYETILISENPLVGGNGLETGFRIQRSGAPGSSDDDRAVLKGVMGRFEWISPARFVGVFARMPPLVAPLALVHRWQEVTYKQDVCNESTVNYFGDWLRNRSDRRPFYAFFNLVDTHDPYELVPQRGRLGLLDRVYLWTPRFFLLTVPEIRTRLRWDALVAGYVRSIEQADRKIGLLLKHLESAGERERTLIVVTSDHGQAFGEGGNAYHGSGVTDSLTRVPLVVAPPRGTRVPRRIDRWVSLCEIDSWIRAAAGGLAPYDERGVAPPPYSNLVPEPHTVYCEGAAVSDYFRSLADLKTDQSWHHRLLAAYRGPEKFVLDLETSELVRWGPGTEDPDQETPDRLSGEAAAELRREVFGPYEAQEAARKARTLGRPPPVDVEIDARLRAWGYD